MAIKNRWEPKNIFIIIFVLGIALILLSNIFNFVSEKTCAFFSAVGLSLLLLALLLWLITSMFSLPRKI